MRPKIIAALIRHGDYAQLADTPSAHQPFALVAKGRQQARTGADELHAIACAEGWSLDTVIDSSSLLRAWQTARLINDHLTALGLPSAEVESFDALTERGLGSAANLTLQQISAVIRDDPRFPQPPPNWKATSDYRLPLPGAESLLEAGERVAAHISARMQTLRGGTETSIVKLFVGHGAAFRHAAYQLGVLQFEQIAQLSMHHARPVLLEYLADGSWCHLRGEWKVRGANSRSLD